MTEIILSFFAVIGITLLTLQFCDYIFFRKFKSVLPLIVDLREKNPKETIEIFELITTVRQKTSGKAAISKIIVIIDSKNDQIANIAQRYMDIFQIPGSIFTNNEWAEKY